MNVVDSSGWLEFFSGGKNAHQFLAPVEDSEHLIVPTISLFEVFKVLLRESDETQALQATAFMKQGKVIGLSDDIALNAAKFSHDKKVPMADSIIFTTAKIYQATLWTQDDDFVGLEGVKYFPKPK